MPVHNGAFAAMHHETDLGEGIIGVFAQQMKAAHTGIPVASFTAHIKQAGVEVKCLYCLVYEVACKHLYLFSFILLHTGIGDEAVQQKDGALKTYLSDHLVDRALQAAIVCCRSVVAHGNFDFGELILMRYGCFHNI